MSKNFIAILFLAAMFVWFGTPEYGPTAAYGDTCLSQGEARQAVQKGDAISLSEIRGSLAGNGGEVVSAQLCKAGNRLVYIVNVLDNGGEVKRVHVDARSGSIMGR